MRRIVVETARVLETADRIEEAKEEYKRLYFELYDRVDLLAGVWTGADNQKFTTKIKSYEDDFRRISVIMMQYVDFLRHSAKAYVSTQEELINQAEHLKT